MSFTWWGGVIGPRVLTHVKCPRCGHAYNGKSGGDNTAGIVIYSGVVAVVMFGFIFSLFAVAGILTVLAK
jgi:uncharacterized protein (DUF983 family)